MTNSYETINDALAKRLRAGFAAYLDVSTIDVDDPLVDHVDDALPLEALVDVVRACGATNVTRIDVLACATLRELAALVERTGGVSREADIGRVVVQAESHPASHRFDAQVTDTPASPAQQDLWLAAQVQEEGAAYHLSLALRFDAPVDSELLKRALAEVTARHLSLRTTFLHDTDGLRQYVHAGVEVDWTESTLPATDEADLRDALTQFAQQRFDLQAGPLFRVCLYRVGADHDVLQFVVHHIVFDAWSRLIVSRDIVDAYRALQAGREIVWQADAVPAEAFAHSQHAALTPERTARLREYWRTQLTGVPQVLDLPTDFTRPSVRDGAGATSMRMLPPALAERLAAVGAKHGASLFMTLMAAWQILLWRYSRQDEFAIGTPMSTRDVGAFESTVGYFVNTVVIRARLYAEEPFSALLARVAQVTLDGYEHKTLPLREMIQVAGASRNPSHTPLFQVMFEFHNERQPAKAASKESNESTEPVLTVPHDVGAAKYDLSLEIAHRHDGLACAIEYATALFARSSVDGMLAQYEVLLEQIAAMPDAPVAALSCLPARELDNVTRAWNGNAFEPAGSPLIHERFDARLRSCPGATAVWFDNASMTFAQLGERVDALAGQLVERTGGEPKRIAICLERSFEMVIAVLAILKAGCAYVPLDPRLPAERIDFMLDDSAAALLVTVASIRDERFAAHRIETLCIDERALRGTASARAVMPVISEQAIAYVLYTSGSTGMPKGVVVTHANVTNLLDTLQARYPLEALDCYLLKTNYAFDVSVPELFGWFIGHGSLAILPPQAEGSPDLIIDALLRHGVTHVNFTPSMLRQFVPETAADARFARAHRLRYVFVAGEELTRTLADDALSALRPAAIENLYGPTEATVFATGYSYAAPIANGKVPIGRGLGNVRVYVLDERMRPMPVGMPGDLYIAGNGVARGYLNRDELTAQRFLPDPFTPGGSIYMTGDLARWTRDGTIEFLGRTDQQIKIRGYRIELDEVTSALSTHPLVDEAAVHVKRSGDGAVQLVAYVVPAGGLTRTAAPDDAAQIRHALVSALGRRLPDYMVPSTYVFIASLPKGITGKLNRKALEEIPFDEPVRHDASGAVAPRDDTERSLWEIWRSVLRVPELGVTDNFFAIGGDSILSIQVAARARQRGIAFSARDLFRYQTIERLASNVRRQGPQEQRQVSRGDMPLLPIHRWFFAIDSTHVDHYHQSRLLDVPASVDASFMEAWLQALVVRHDALRLRFERSDAGWRAHFTEPDAWDGTVRLMVRGGDAAHAPDATADAFFSAARHSVSLTDGPLFIAALAEGDVRGRSRLLLVGHHAVVDGVSWRVILDDFRQALAQWTAGRTVTPEPGGDGYLAWARAVAAASDSPALRAERDHWLGVLRAPVPRLRPDLDDECADPTRRATRVQSFGLDAADTRALLAETHHAYRTHLIELLLAGLLLATHRWRGHDTLRIALEGHGREAEVLAQYGVEGALPDIGETVGWFTSYYPQLLTLAGDVAATSDLVATTTAVVTAIMAVKAQYRATPHHGLGYGILRHVASDTELAAAEADHTPEIVFNYLGQFDVADDEATGIAVLDTSSREDITAARPREHTLGINGEIKDGCLAFEIDYAVHAFDAATIAALGTHFMDALREIVAHCKTCVAWCPTPEDFPLTTVTRDELAGWHTGYPMLETLYPATAIQWGMVFHSLLPGEASAYTNQIYATVGGGFDAARFQRAWESLVERHAVLRTAFVGFEREQPLQIVLSQAASPWRNLDHRGLSPDARVAAFDALLAQDKTTPFDFGSAPLMRFHLVREDDTTYRFIWTYHHAVLDGWSVQLIWSDLLSAYAAMTQGHSPSLPAAAQFREVVAWRQYRSLDADRRYWKEEIGTRTQRTMLHIEQPERAVESDAPHVVTRALDEAATQRLVEVVRAVQTTLAIALQASWALVLGRYSGESSPVFGVTTSGRAIDVHGIETIVGPLIATVPVRVDIEPSMPLRDWLRRVHERHVERETHAQLDLIDIQRESGLRGGQALFDSLLIVENYPLAEQDGQRILGLRDHGYAEDTHYGLTVSAKPGPRLCFEIAFDRSRYHIEDIEIMADNLKAMLNRIPEHLEHAVGELRGGVGNASVGASSYAHGDGGIPLSCVTRQGDLRLGRHLVPHLFEDHAAATPERRALVYNDRAYSYDQLNRAANRIANRLMQAFPELGTDSLVGVRIARSDRLALTVLAIWKIGAAYIPIDPVLPAQRMHDMLDLAGAKALIVDASVAAAEPAVAGMPRIVFDDLVMDDPLLEDNPEVHLSGNDLSYVLFTSGSTGKPKGAMIEHIGMLNNIANKALDLAMDEDSRVAQNASMSFDVSVWQMFIALTKGGTTFVYDDRVVNDIAGLIQRMHTDSLTILEVVPTYLQALVEYMEEHPDCPRPAALTFMMVNGETVDAALLKRWFALCPASKVINAYGPTEASDDITHHIMSPGDEIVNPVPIGRALANFDIYIVDDELRPVPIGTRGEIVVTGVGVGRGYVGMAGVTAQAFVKSPFPDRYKGRLYRTGDLGAMREDGVLMFHGRKDRQVKVRGMRIELEEVEASLRAIPTVRQAAVLVIQPENREAFLCAYVVPHADERDAIVNALKAKLPPYMVPSVFRFETELPQLPSGKVDRNRLREQFQLDVPCPTAVAPRTPVEERLTEIFRGVLGHAAFGIRDDFFDLGGDSFKAIRIAAKYGPPLEVTDIYDHPTIEALAEHLEHASEESSSIVLMAGDPATAKAVVVCVANAAGGPVNFVDMSRAMPEQASDVAMFGVKLPRTEVDSDGAMLEEVRRLSNAVCDDLLAATDLPAIVFAQCNGSALALAITRELVRRSADVRALCIGGALMRTVTGKRDTRTDDEILAFLGKAGSTLPAQPDEQAFFLHDFRYDGWLADVYYNHLVDLMSRGALEVVDIPVWCLVGSEDPLVPNYPVRFQDWSHIGRPVQLVEYAGIGHYLLRDCPEAIARAVGSVWEHVSCKGVTA
ncbi:non-ribosomal peptide synthetase [Paraburkholderia acidicola]|uniref:Non-ribosomal peptide synthetase n=5 Tax=Paraburkholderia acidicola TaxID=1912599 RepID=A0A1I9RH13_9BURK|nr:non-ribosomal peptide synthetase [Paraburkholderia acidicola]AOZ21320.1 SulM [Paraburkholderia acidicola]PCE22686.1 non-ribosomal peptide synthetase [Paraburkholderia acidicola]